MPKSNSKDSLILQKLNKQTVNKKNNQFTLLVHILCIVLLIGLIYGVTVIYSIVMKGGTTWL